jgi:hypothetical protein
MKLSSLLFSSLLAIPFSPSSQVGRHIASRISFKTHTDTPEIQ